MSAEWVFRILAPDSSTGAERGDGLVLLGAGEGAYIVPQDPTAEPRIISLKDAARLIFSCQVSAEIPVSHLRPSRAASRIRRAGATGAQVFAWWMASLLQMVA